MVFSSLTFLCVFLPAVFVLYTLLPRMKAKNAVLLVASVFFYAYGEPVYALLLIFSSLLNYTAAMLIGGGKARKAVLAASVVLNLGLLAVFKYSGMFVSSLNAVAGLSLPVPQIALPIGISFFTFQALSYVIDVYRGTVERQKNYFYVLLYISFFPQLIAGPIVKYRDISDRLADRRQDPSLVANGMARFVCGLAKKVLIANTMGAAADAVFAAAPADLSALTAWVGAVAYLFQIYYDFSGYSDMAIGLGRMFGFDFKENFLYPYGANNVQDFWRKWHVSLSTWFKEYLYIPLGGNRKGRGRTVLNRLVVFLLTGLWHGANWTFVVWGLWHGLFLLLEEFVPALRRLPKALGRVYTLLVVLLGFVVFRADTISYGLAYIGRLFTGFGASNAAGLEQLTPWFLVMLVAAVVGCAPIKPLVDKLRAAVSGDGKGAKAARAAVAAAALVGLVWCLLRLAPSGYNPFIYFRF